MPTAFLFDMDGTLVDLTFQAKEARLEIFSALESMGFNIERISALQYTLEIFDEVRRQAQSLPNGKSYQDASTVMLDILDRYELQGLQSANIRDTVLPTLEELKRRSFKMGLVTNSGERAVGYVLGRYDLSKFFHCVTNRDNIGRIKPDGEGIRRTLKVIGVEPSDALFVGDSPVDAMAARDAGVRIAMVTVPKPTRERFLKASADFLISKLEDLLDILKIEVSPRTL